MKGSEEPQKHRKKRRKRKVALDEDDIALIAESRGEPGPQKSKKTSFKRLRKTTGLDADDAMAVEQSLFGSEGSHISSILVPFICPAYFLS